MALLLSFVLWFEVSESRRERVSERTYAAPIVIVGIPRDVIVTTPLPDSISVRLRGRVSDLRALSSQSLEVSIDASWAQPGKATVTLGPQALNVPPAIEVVSIDPKKLSFTVEALRQKAVPIRPFLAGDPPRGFLAGVPLLVPDSALISGPASEVRKISEVTTERIIMTGRTEPFTQNVSVISDSPLIHVLQPSTVQVNVPVGPEVGPLPPSDMKTEETEGSQSRKAS